MTLVDFLCIVKAAAFLILSTTYDGRNRAYTPQQCKVQPKLTKIKVRTNTSPNQ